ncbi:MAG: hypothetical protein CM1200mP22_09310 [Dehalococcoidia bacterium]|nr:MAG: hypothetical protein CM1200mP22_09310 [Dehalococcoidia bacterium]
MVARIKEVVGSRWDDLFSRNPGMYEMDDGEKEISALVTESSRMNIPSPLSETVKNPSSVRRYGSHIQQHVRSDGRALDQVRPITCDTGILPRTQVPDVPQGGDSGLVYRTVGSLALKQTLDTVAG